MNADKKTLEMALDDAHAKGFREGRESFVNEDLVRFARDYEAQAEAITDEHCEDPARRVTRTKLRSAAVHLREAHLVLESLPSSLPSSALHVFVPSGRFTKGVYGNDVDSCADCGQSPAHKGHIAPKKART